MSPQLLDLEWARAMDATDDKTALTCLNAARKRCGHCGWVCIPFTTMRRINSTVWVTRTCNDPACIQAAQDLLEGL